VSFAPGARGRLTEHDLARFTGNTLFDRIGRVVCGVGRLPRKELYEAWEVARRARRLFRGGRVVDLAAGHGLLAQIMLILDDTSPRAVAADVRLPRSAAALHEALVQRWPRLAGRVEFLASPLDSVTLDRQDVVVSSHACGRLTDLIIDRAIEARARLAVLPCCHDAAVSETGGLEGWMESGLAIDVMRARQLQAEGYRIWTQTIPATITPKNRLLLAAPDGEPRSPVEGQ